MGIKSKLPQGIYISNEYPLHIKRATDMLWLILQLAKSLPMFLDKSKIEGDHLVINGVHYSLQDIHKLPPELAALKVPKRKTNTTSPSTKN